jgi:hypothetical protein
LIDVFADLGFTGKPGEQREDISVAAPLLFVLVALSL